MRSFMRTFALLGLLLVVGQGCGKDEKSSAERDAEVQKALQQGAQKERQMYEGMQKGVEDLEKKAQEKKESPK
ncbi:MAG: hypothetical protein HY695_34765 [Deltaproteobacteria bacterium]|nr:hypothetical protein [Deltaproteobacteria bacterium]